MQNLSLTWIYWIRTSLSQVLQRVPRFEKHDLYCQPWEVLNDSQGLGLQEVV